MAVRIGMAEDMAGKFRVAVVAWSPPKPVRSKEIRILEKQN